MLLHSNTFTCRIPTFIRTVNHKYLQTSQQFRITSRAIRHKSFKNSSHINTIAACPYLSHNSLFRNFSTEKLPKHKDIFGDLGSYKHERVEMDEAEAAEEKFTENEAQLPRRFRMSPGKYADLIKSHLQKMDLKSACSVLDLLKSNRDKPTVYMFTLLMRAYSVQGDMKQTFRLYNKMKKYGLKPNDATYTSLINSIAQYSPNSEYAMNKLFDLRKMFLEKGVVLNSVHYNAIINAYGRHNKVKEAFLMADEMKDKGFNITLNTFNSLLCCAASEIDGGLRLALMVWYMMKLYKISPNTTSYNLLLRCIKETSFGDLKVNDLLLKNNEDSKIKYVEHGRPNLLENPPVVTEVTLITDSENNMNSDTEKRTSKRTGKAEPQMNKSIVSVEKVGGSESNKLEPDLNNIHKHNKLILFGGFQRILNMMEEDKAVPNVKTFTYLITLVPNSVAIEDMIVEKCKKMNIPLDHDFFNILMKKRCFRHQYDSARMILNDMERCNLFPDIITWGTLALTCDVPDQGTTLIETMENVGCQPNAVIIGILLIKAMRSTRKTKHDAMINLMKYMDDNDIVPTAITIKRLDLYHRQTIQLIKEKGRSTKFQKLKISFNKFDKVYKTWRRTHGPKIIVHES